MSRSEGIFGRRARDRIFAWICASAAFTSLVLLAVLLSAILIQGRHHLLPGPIRAHILLERVPAETDFSDGERAGRGSWLVESMDRDDLRVALPAGVEGPITVTAQALDPETEAPLEGMSAEVVLPPVEMGAEWSEVDLDPVVSRLPRQPILGPLRDFVTSGASNKAWKAGIQHALVGSVLVCLVCALTALPLGVGTAILLEEYRPRGAIPRRLHTLVQLNISNLAGVPSIIYGIVGLTVFAQLFNVMQGREAEFLVTTTGGPNPDPEAMRRWYFIGVPFQRSVLTGGLTLMLVILPIVIIASQEALRSVPYTLREASHGLAATRWQTIRQVVLPAAVPGIMTGSILSISRAIGEAAPILVIAGIVFINFLPGNLMDSFTVMPLQIYNWAGEPRREFHEVAASGIIILLAVLLLFNATAVFIRHRFGKDAA